MTWEMILCACVGFIVGVALMHHHERNARVQNDRLRRLLNLSLAVNDLSASICKVLTRKEGVQ